MVYSSKADQMRLLHEVLLQSEKDTGDDEEGVTIVDDITTWKDPAEKGVKKIQNSSMKSLSGADDMAYIEINRGNTGTKKTVERSKLFKKYMK